MRVTKNAKSQSPDMIPSESPMLKTGRPSSPAAEARCAVSCSSGGVKV